MMTPINSSLLRLLWSVVEDQGNRLRGLNDEALSHRVFKNIKEKQFLSAEEAVSLRQYIAAHTLLIRDVVEGAQ